MWFEPLFPWQTELSSARIRYVQVQAPPPQVAEQIILYVFKMFVFGQLRNGDESKSYIHKSHKLIKIYCIFDVTSSEAVSLLQN